MKNCVCWGVWGAVFVFLLVGCEKTPKEPDALFDDAVRHAERMRSAECYGDALEEFCLVSNSVARIVSELPSSDVARELLSGDRRIGGFLWEEFEALNESLLPLACAEQDLNDCAFALATCATEDEAHFQTNLLFNLVESYARCGETNKSACLLSSLVDSASTCTNAERQVRNLFRCAEGYDQIEVPERAALLRTRAFEVLSPNVLDHVELGRFSLYQFVGYAVTFFDAGEVERGEYFLGLAQQLATERGSHFLEIASQTGEELNDDFKELPDRFGVTMEFLDIADSLARNGYMNRALELIELNVDDEFRHVAFNGLLWSGGDDISQLMQVLNATLTLDDEFDRNMILPDLVECFAAMGAFPQATMIITSYMGENSWSRERDRAWQCIAREYVELGMLESAVWAANRIVGSGDQSEIFAQIAVAYKKKGDLDVAEEWFGWLSMNLPSDYYVPSRLSSLCGIAEQYIKGEETLRAVGVLARAAIVAANPKNYEYRDHGHLPEIAQLYARNGQMGIAKNLLSTSAEWAENITGEYRDDYLVDLANTYAATGQLKPALEAIKDIEVDDWDTQGIIDIFCEYCFQNGQLNQLLDQLSSCGLWIDLEDKAEWLVDFLKKKGLVEDLLLMTENENYSECTFDAIDAAFDLQIEQKSFADSIRSITLFDQPLTRAGRLVQVATALAEEQVELGAEELEPLRSIVAEAYPIEEFWSMHGQGREPVPES